MKIKISPENDMEKQRIKEVIHTGVQEFFICGIKKNDERAEDFHDWKGSHRYLIGSISYLLNEIVEDRNIKHREEEELKKLQEREIDIKPAGSRSPLLFKKGDVDDFKVLDTEEIKNDIKKDKENEGKNHRGNKNSNAANDEFVPQDEVEEKELTAEDENN